MSTDIEEGIPQIVTAEEQRPPRSQASKPPQPPQDPLQALLSSQEASNPTSFKPAVFLERLSGSDQTYKVLVEWIPRAPGGVLKEISMTADANAHYKLVLMDEVMFQDKVLSASLSLDFKRMPVLAQGKKIQVQVKSIAGVAITVDGTINGEQRL